MIDVGVHQPSVGQEADKDEDASDVEARLLAGGDVAQTHPAHLRGALDRLHRRVEDEVDLGILPGLLHQDGLGAKLGAPVDDGDPARVAGQEKALLHGGIAPAHHCQMGTLEEGAIADGAIGDPNPGQLGLSGDTQLAGVAPGGDDHRGRAQLALVRLHHLGPVRLHPDPLHRGGDHLGAELSRLIGHDLSQVGSEDGPHARVVLDQLGVEQLPAGAHQRSVDDGALGLQEDGPNLVATGVEGCRQARRATAHDDDVVLTLGLAICHGSALRMRALNDPRAPR